MQDDSDIIIEKLKLKYLASNDQELARALKLSRSSVATWRNRGSVPKKYAELASSEHARKFYGDTPWELWGPIEKAGMQLALLRMLRDYRTILDDYRSVLNMGHTLPDKLADFHGEACADIVKRMAEMGGDDLTRANVALQQLTYSEFDNE